MPKRIYKLTEKQKRAASKWYKKGYTTHGKLSKKLGVSRQKVSNWLKSKKIGKRVEQPFWKDVKGIVEMKGKTWKQAKMEVKYSKKWFERRQKRLKGVAKVRDIIGEKTQRIKEGEIPDDWFTTEEGEGMMEFAGYD
jgi:predicted DNA-binding protein YlxM (UPF0122 family)